MRAQIPSMWNTHELVVEQLNLLAHQELANKELAEAKAQLKGKLLLSQENTSNRMMRLAKVRFITSAMQT